MRCAQASIETYAAQRLNILSFRVIYGFPSSLCNLCYILITYFLPPPTVTEAEGRTDTRSELGRFRDSCCFAIV